MQEFFSTFCRYWKLIIKLGFERWDRGEFMVTILLLVITPIIAVFIGWKFEFTGIQWSYSVLGALGFDILVIIPTKIGMRYIRATTPRLSITVDEKPEISKEPGREHIWWHLNVKNMSKKSIRECYGKIISFEPNPDNKPYKSYYLPWSSYSGAFSKTMTIPPSPSGEVLDLVMVNQNGLWPFYYKDPKIRGTSLHEGVGKYRITVEVGSLEELFKPSTIEVEADYINKDEFNVKEISKTKNY